MPRRKFYSSGEAGVGSLRHVGKSLVREETPLGILTLSRPTLADGLVPIDVVTISELFIVGTNSLLHFPSVVVRWKSVVSSGRGFRRDDRIWAMTKQGPVPVDRISTSFVNIHRLRRVFKGSVIVGLAIRSELHRR